MVMSPALLRPRRSTPVSAPVLAPPTKPNGVTLTTAPLSPTGVGLVGAPGSLDAVEVFAPDAPTGVTASPVANAPSAPTNVSLATVPSAPTSIGLTGQPGNVAVQEVFTPDAPTGVTLTPQSTDPYFSDVILLLQDSLIDESPAGLTVTNSGATLETSSPKVGSASFGFSGSASVSAAYDPVMDWGTGDFTIEYWLYTETQSDYKVLNRDSSSGGRIFINNFNSSAGGVGGLTFGIPAQNATVVVLGTVPAQTWTYVTITRTSGVLYYGLNGNLSSTAWAHSLPTGTRPIEIGKQGAYGGLQLVGKIDSLRITNVGRYTANFTPPTQAFPN